MLAILSTKMTHRTKIAQSKKLKKTKGNYIYSNRIHRLNLNSCHGHSLLRVCRAIHVTACRIESNIFGKCEIREQLYAKLVSDRRVLK